MDEAKKFAEEHLDAFKKRMRITHDDENETLKKFLASSAVAIATLVGASAYDEAIYELVAERAMYAYNDALDEFKKAYAGEIEDLYLRNMIIANEVSDNDAE